LLKVEPTVLRTSGGSALTWARSRGAAVWAGIGHDHDVRLLCTAQAGRGGPPQLAATVDAFRRLRVMLRTASPLPRHRVIDAGFRPGPFAGWIASMLPGLLAATRTGLSPAGDDKLSNSKICFYVTA
jgi:hypothetical protein